jgi:hypothetical protein
MLGIGFGVMRFSVGVASAELVAGAELVADGVVLVGASLVLLLQPAVRAPIPTMAAPPATSARRRVR